MFKTKLNCCFTKVMLILYREIVTLLLVCVNLSTCENVRPHNIDYKENHNALYKINSKQNDKLLKTGFHNKRNNIDGVGLHDRDSFDREFVLMPVWKVKSTRTKRYSYDSFLPQEDSNLNSAVVVEKPNKVKIEAMNFIITQKQETCFPTVQNEIANLFDEDFDPPKKIFPLCCKTKTQCQRKTTKCMPVLKTVPKLTQKIHPELQPRFTQKIHKELTVQPKHTIKHRTSSIPTSVHYHSVSNEAVVNVVIRVKCDHPEAREHVLPTTISIIPPSSWAAQNTGSHLPHTSSNYNFSVRLSANQTTEVTKYSVFRTTFSLNETKVDDEACLKKYDNSRSNESPDDRLFAEQDKEDSSTDDLKMKFPQPFMPHDLTIRFTKPTRKAQVTAIPAFICQITPSLCKYTDTKSVIVPTRSVKPSFTLWKKINLPRFRPHVPATQNNGGPKTESTCENEKTYELTTGEQSCALDVHVNEKPYKESTEHQCSDEQTDPSITVPIQCDSDSKNLKVFTVDQPIFKSSQVVTEPVGMEASQLSPGQDEPTLPTYSVLLDQPYDKLNTRPGVGFSNNFLQSSDQERTTIQDDDFGSKSNSPYIFISGQTPTEPFTEPGSLLFVQTDTPLFGTSTLAIGIPSSREHYDSTNVNPYSHEIKEFNPLAGNPMSRFLDKSTMSPNDTVVSTVLSINKIIGSEQSFDDISTSASDAAAFTLQMSTESNPSSLTVLDHSTTTTHLGSVSDRSIASESIILPTTPEIHSFETSNQTESVLLMSLLDEHLSTVEENSIQTSEGDADHIIELNNNSLLFYSNNKWFITNRNHLWSFDEGTVEIVNDTFMKMSEEHSADSNEKNKEVIKDMLSQRRAIEESEEVPFEIFVEAILVYSEHNHHINTFEWSGIYLNLNEMIAMLRIASVDSSWESVNWMNIYRLVKEESHKTTTEDKYEYRITDIDGSILYLTVFLNGTSIWKNVKLGKSEMLSIVQNVNSKTFYFKQIIYVPYKSNDQTLTSFVNNVFQLQINSNWTYLEYVWESSTYRWDEILALVVLINAKLTDISNLEINRYWDELLVKLRNSKQHYYPDRSVYDIVLDTEVQPMTIFTNGTTDFNGKRMSLEEVAQRVREITVSDVKTSDVQHIINLGGGKFQFYWHGKWYITDHSRTWSFEEQTSVLMNESFFNMPEDLAVSQESIQEVLVETIYHRQYEMPFGLFTQCILTAANFSEQMRYLWGGYSLSYADVFAMLRLSNFNNIIVQTPDLKWGEINWHTIYDKLKQSPKSTSPGVEAYEMLDYDGSVYPLIVFSNGTSIWKHSKLDLAESLTTLKNLNSETYFPDAISTASYTSNAHSFMFFLTEAIADRIHNKVLYSFYNWKHFQFLWDDLVAINRILLHHYESKEANNLSFSKLAFPILSSTKKLHPDKTEFHGNLDSASKPLIVYPNGTTDYDNVRSEFMDTVQKVKELQRTSNMVFKEDWESGVITLKEVITNNPDPEDNTSSKGGYHNYDWQQLNNNPYFNVCYPINLGGGKVQFYMKNTWFITDGDNIWPFEDPLTSFYINEMVKGTNQMFTDDPHLDKTTIQRLVDSKQTLRGTEELVMPHELIIHHYLFFMQHMERQAALNISKDIIYRRKKLHINSVQLITALRLSAYNNFTTRQVELLWEHGKKPNWDWFFFMSKRSERMQITDEWSDSLNTSYFDEFQNTPLLIVYSNRSSDWGGQRLELDEALLNIQTANEHNSFLPVEVNGELTSKNESFEGLFKEALNKRLEHKRTYSEYKWLTDSVSWFDILVVLRVSEAKSEALHDNVFWKNCIKGITRSLKSKYSDRLEYEVNTDVKVTIYMNESTVYNGKKMDIEEYRVLL